VGRAEVGIDAVADHERPARAEPVQRRPDERRLGLADRLDGAPGRRLDCGDDGARPGPQAVGRRERRIAVGADQERTAQRGLRRVAQLGVVELRVERDDDDVRAACERRAVDDS
jgi:hypothetical protein